jgi:hypothetical protein
MERRLDEVGERIGELAVRLEPDPAAQERARIEHGRLHDSIDRVHERLARIEQDLERSEGASHVAGLTEMVGDVRSEITALGERLGGRVEAAVAAIAAPPASPPPPAPPVLSAQAETLTSTIERHLDEIQEQVMALGTRLAGFEASADREYKGIAAPALDSEELIRRSGGGAAPGGGDLDGIERHMNHLAEQMTALGARLANFELDDARRPAAAVPGLPAQSAAPSVSTAAIESRLDTLQKPAPAPAPARPRQRPRPARRRRAAG